MCVCVCVLCACIYIVLLYTFCSLVYFEEKFRNGNERKINHTPHKNSTTSARTYQCRKYSTAKNTTTMSTSTGTLSFFFARTCDRNWDYTVASARKTRRDEKIFFGSAYSLFCCCLRSRDDLKISNAKEEFTCSHHRCGTRKKAKTEKREGEVPILRCFLRPRRRSGVEEDERISLSF